MALCCRKRRRPSRQKPADNAAESRQRCAGSRRLVAGSGTKATFNCSSVEGHDGTRVDIRVGCSGHVYRSMEKGFPGLDGSCEIHFPGTALSLCPIRGPEVEWVPCQKCPFNFLTFLLQQGELYRGLLVRKERVGK